MAKNRIIPFVTFLVAATVCIILCRFLASDYYLVASVCIAFATAILIPSYLEEHLNSRLRIILFLISGLLLVLALLSLVMTEANLDLKTFCLFFAIIELINGIAEVFEGIFLLKKKDYLAFALFVSALLEIVLGVLMIFERHETLRLHMYLLGANLYFEGIAKFVSETIKERKGKTE